MGQKNAPSTLEELNAFVPSLLKNVVTLHTKAQILHGYLKPDNTALDVVTVSLLGHAQDMKDVRSVEGTKGYEAPEVLNGEVNTCLTDAFGAGKLLHKILKKLATHIPNAFELHCILYNIVLSYIT